MFQQVQEYELEYNQTYKIIAGHEYKGRFKGDFKSDLQYLEVYLEFDCVYNMTIQTCCEPSLFSSLRDFYKFVSQKPRIQSDMERRAVNLIVRRLIGDDCFQW